MRRFIFVVIAVLTILIVSFLPSAHAQVVPPNFVLTEANRVAQFAGKTLSGNPTSTKTEINARTGHTLWTLCWKPIPEEPKAICIVVDEQAGKAISYSDDFVVSDVATSFKAGATFTVNETQALMLLNNVMTNLPCPSGDWRVSEAKIDSFGLANGQPTEPFWMLMKRRYYENRYVTLGAFSMNVNPYDGKIAYWSASSEAVFSPPTMPIRTLSQVEGDAISAFTQFASPLLRAGDSTAPIYNTGEGGYWAWLSETSTICRLMHTFRFLLPEIEDPNYDPDSEVPFQGRRKIIVQVDIDAETGELADISCPFGSGSIPIQEDNTPKFSPRVSLLQKLLKHHPLFLLSLSVSGGRATYAVAPSSQATQFSVKTNQGVVHFAFNPTAKRLTWKLDSGQWTGVVLKTDDVQTMQKFLQSQK